MTTDPVPEIVRRFRAEHFTLNSITERRAYYTMNTLERFCAFLDVPIEEATDRELRAFVVELMESDLKASTVAWHLKMIKPFYHWAWRERIIDADAWMRIQEVASPRGHNSQAPRPYAPKELRRMWSQLDARFPLTTDIRLRRWKKGTSRFRGPLKRHAMRRQLDAMIELALVCGMRKSEIFYLSIEDCHWDNKYIVVHGKRVDQNAKVRDVPYPDSTREAVREWFRIRGAMGPEPGIGLWLSITGPVPEAALLERRMASILHSIGPWEFHRLRHTCATERLRSGMELHDLQRFLGHSTLQQTLAYAKIVRDDVHAAAARNDVAFQRAIRPAA